MLLSHHPFQRLGARAAAALTGRASAADITDSDLDALVDRIATDCVVAAHATRNGPGWVWLARLATMYPNSPATHPIARAKPDMETKLRALFVADGSPRWRCQLCQQAYTQVRWDRSRMPLGKTRDHINHSIDGRSGGDPTCRACRIAVWCLPYGVDHAGGAIWSIDTLSPQLESAVVTRLADRAERITTERWDRVEPDADPRDAIVADVMAHPAPVAVSRWKNDNRGATMHTWTIQAQAAHWLREVAARGYWPVLTALAGTQHPLYVAADAASPVLTDQFARSDTPAEAMPALHALEASLARRDTHLLDPAHLDAFHATMGAVSA